MNCHPDRSEAKWRDLLFPSIHSPPAQWKRRPPLCHPDRSGGICSSTDLSWKCFSTRRSPGPALFSLFQTELSSRPERSEVEGPLVHPPQHRSSMEAPSSPLSSRPKWRDLQFNGPLVEMFFDRSSRLEGPAVSPSPPGLQNTPPANSSKPKRAPAIAAVKQRLRITEPCGLNLITRSRREPAHLPRTKLA
jgi:hypothetical protein